LSKLDKEIGKIKIENEALKEKLYDLAKIVENMNKLISYKEASITAKLPDIDFTDKDNEFQEREITLLFSVFFHFLSSVLVKYPKKLFNCFFAILILFRTSNLKSF
ncbi:unnamed protein product, partial [marine sediment metagenome]